MGSKMSGFAALSPERRRAIARQGGLAAHHKGSAYEWSVEDAKRAGAKGGQAAQRARQARQQAAGAANAPDPTEDR